jgi:hypothetical protein
MGQISVPAMNKTGYSMYWSSMWDDKNNFSRLLSEDIFIKKFIPLLIEDNILIKNFNKNNFKANNVDLNYKYSLAFNVDINLNNVYSYIYSLNKIIFYTSKIWVVKYQTWILIFFYIYSPFNKLFKDKSDGLNNFNLNNSVSNDIVYNYYISILKTNYNYNFFKASLFFKFF